MATLTRGRDCTVTAFDPLVAGHLLPCAAPRDVVRIADSGPSSTVTLDGAVLAIAGLVIYGRSATAWAVVTDAGRGHPVMVHRTVKRFLGALVRQHRLRRVEARALQHDHAAHRWLEALGFWPESTAALWGPNGETAWTYVLLYRD